MGASSRCGQWGLLSACGQWGLPLVADNGDCSLGAGLRFLIAAAALVEHRLQGMKASVVGAHGLSCPTVCGLFSNQGLNLCPFIDRWILYHLAVMVCVHFYKFNCLFLVEPGLCFTRAFSLAVASRAVSLVVVHGCLVVVASLVAEHRLLSLQAQ